jgi:hypothetical protein
MAINPVSAELLLLCRSLSPERRCALMLGRQWIRLSRAQATELQTRHALPLFDLCDDEGRDAHYGEPFLQRLGFTLTDSLDADAYQGAGLIHDLNTPLPPDWHGRYDWVFDGGTLEHVFDLPQASKNVAALLREGGLFIAMSPCNNWMGHGLYQFSPELLFRLYSPSRGFRCRFAALYEHDSGRFLALEDPALNAQRHAYNPPGRLSLLFVAQKTTTLNPTASLTQSDYQSAWLQGLHSAPPTPSSPPSLLRRCTPPWLAQIVRQWHINRRRRQEGRPKGQSTRCLQQLWRQTLRS